MEDTKHLFWENGTPPHHEFQPHSSAIELYSDQNELF